MKSRIISVMMVAVLAFAAVFRGRGKSQSRARETSITMRTVEIETSRAAGISVRIAESFPNIVDDGARRRVLPVEGQGPPQNLTDRTLQYCIYMAIMQVGRGLIQAVGCPLTGSTSL